QCGTACGSKASRRPGVGKKRNTETSPRRLHRSLKLGGWSYEVIRHRRSPTLYRPAALARRGLRKRRTGEATQQETREAELHVGVCDPEVDWTRDKPRAYLAIPVLYAAVPARRPHDNDPDRD